MFPHSTKRKAAFVEAVVAQIQAYGVARQVLPLLMEGEGVEIAMDCGCTFGAPSPGEPSYQACSSHRSSSAPRVCFCGLNYELTEATRRAYKPFTKYSEERAAELQRRRIFHFEKECCHTPWKADEVPEAIEDTELEEPSMLSDDEILRRLFPEADHA